MEYLFHVNPDLDGKKLMIYGLDTRGKLLFHALLQLGVKVEAFCTRKYQHTAGLAQVFGKKVFSFDELVEHPEDFFVIVPGITAHNDVRELRRIGVSHIIVENITFGENGILLEEDFFEQLPIRKMLREKIPIRIEYGGISVSTRYDAEARTVLVNGWFLPVSTYDEVQVFAGENYLGKAQLRCLREDVYANFPQYAEYRSGWRLCKKIELSLPCTIMVKCFHQGAIVKVSEKIITRSERISPEEVHHG